ncbi:enoyl-CoA hydratase/isomerase family protein [Nocardia sp. NPDC004711]
MSDLIVDRHGGTTVMTINRPDSMNALDRTTMSDLEQAVRELNADSSQTVGIITGTGETAFSAGADLKEMARNASEGGRLPISRAPDFAGVAASEKPIIAAVNGAAIAGGLELAISCDIRISSTKAWFGVFEVKRGILAGVAVNVLPRLMPIGAVMDLMLTGDRLGADDAFRLGLVQAVVEPEELMDRALQKATMIAANSGPAVWATKAVLKYWRDLQLAEQHRYYEAIMHRVLLSGEFLEGPRAFAEKREPNFSNAWPDPFAAR